MQGMAEDIKIDEVQQVKDAAYITVVLADGSLGKIAKADLVELIRINMATATNEYKGLMGTSDLKNLSGLISDNNNINADNLPNGFYRYHQENYNEYNYPAAHGCILTIITDSVGFQLCAEAWPQNFYIRQLWDFWSDWKKI
ncbi:hypothetical protein B5F97_07085 [Bacteroides clarus]|jgi:hypothetical protein|uniref:Uncharacterized protein n=2 Tax=Bacteroides clarus TaxID=626929 RepID=A0A1Y3YU91_9BACE|nr:hypothetical protein B5F97_07085 [Bacteroides clarus]